MLAPYEPQADTQPRPTSLVGFIILFGWAALLTIAASALTLPLFPVAARWPWLGAIAVGAAVAMGLVAVVGMRHQQLSARQWQVVAEMAQRHWLQDAAADEAPAPATAQANLDVIQQLIDVGHASAALLERQHAALSALQQTRAGVPRSSAFDPVTGAITHTALMTRLVTDVAFAQQSGHAVALALFDIDGFHAINERLGYRMGDEVLFAVAERVRGVLQEGDLFGRMGADRFAVVRAGAPFEQMQTLVERILTVVAQEPLAIINPESAAPEQREMVRVTLRAALTLCPDDGTTAPRLVADAEAALRGSANILRDDAVMHRRGLFVSPANAPQEGGVTPFDPLPGAIPPSYIDVMTQRHSSIAALTSALEAHDVETVAHARELAEMAEETALLLGRSIEEARLVGLAALLHDVGNLGIPEEILHKAEPLNAEEWAFVREHPHLGQRLLTSVGGVLAAIAPIVAAHRERWDGTGYPVGLRGDAIPLGARIVAVCDVYGALVSPRPYRAALSHKEAVAEIQRNTGTQFDPAVVQAFFAALR
jgi:diguanylate cyclase (GGDEF)-like protein